MSVIGSNIIAGASGTVETGYQISRSLRFNSADSAYLNRTPSVAGNRKTWTWKGSIKRAALGSIQGLFEAFSSSNNITSLHITAADKISFQDVSGATYNLIWTTDAVFRDPGAHLDIVFSYDSTQASSANAAKLWVNGVQYTMTLNAATGSYLQNRDTFVNSAVSHRMGVYNNTNYLSAYLSDPFLIDGQALDATSFGQTDSATGVWVPKAYTGTYGTNGFWLKLDDNSAATATTLGKDSSGNGNNWTPNNFSVTAGRGNDSLVDSPTNYGTDTGAGGEVRGNYVTLNPLDKGSIDLVNGNLDFQRTSSTTDWEHSRGTIQIPSSGKWYWEVTFNSGTTDGIITGVCPSTFSLSADFGAGSYANVYAWGTFPFLLANNSNTSYGTSPSAGGVIMCAFDRDNSKIYFGLNGTWFNSSNPATQVNPAASSIPADMFPFCGSRSTGNGSANFGQRPFAYTAPSGFKALCTQNLPTPAIGASASTLASKNFNVATYTGNGTTTGNTQAITGLGFQPDLVWIKSRSSATYTHLLTDSVRGANKILYSPLTDAESTVTNVMNSFDSDGFTVAYNSSYTAAVSNANSATFVGWTWKGGGTGVSNTAGSITSTVSANQTAGISIVTYTGTGANATVGHGLGVAPKMIIFKDRTSGSRTTDQWPVYHESIGATKQLYLNATGAGGTSSTVFNNTAPTSSVFSIGTWGGINYSDDAFVAYCFAEIEGFSKFGSYTGNGSTDGPFVYCGFRPRWIMIKNSSAAANWTIVDTARNTGNVANARLFPSTAGSENTAADNVDILSNGFKVRNGTDTGANTSSNIYIFAAFAEAPFNYARAR